MSVAADILAPSASSFFFATLLVWALSKATWFKEFDDQPNERSLHSRPVSRLGGLGMLMGACITIVVGLLSNLEIAFSDPVGNAWLIFGSGLVILVVLGVLDDRFDLSIRSRLPVHLLCSTLMVVTVAKYLTLPDTLVAVAQLVGTSSLVITLALIVVTLLLIWMINLYNFMDGADGLAGLVTVIGFGTYAFLAPSTSLLQWVCASIAGSAAGFLIWNWHPARIFMGDAGSIPLGWAAGSLGLIGAAIGAWPITTPVLIFFPFIFDATITIGLRTIGKQRFWRPHREHIYQRLILAGFSHRTVALIYGALMIPGIVTAGTTSYQQLGMLFTTWTVIISLHTGLYLWARHYTRSTPSIR